MFFPVLLLVWCRSPRAFAALATLAVVFDLTRLQSLDLLVLPAFMLGIVAAHIRVHRVPVEWLAALALVPLCAYGTLIEPPFTDYTNFFHPIWQLAAFALVVCAPLARTALSSLVIVLIGEASYSIYLIHSPAIAIARSVGANGFVCGAVGVFAGLIFWAIIERPLLARDRRARLVADLTFPIRRALTFAGFPSTYSVTGRPSDQSTTSLPEELSLSRKPVGVTIAGLAE